ncbi:MAG: DUF3794 domain-containing protein [Candidatus Limivivens sp.]|nr:DUF3794 domain-containing protein [Candidatus Limivivens sp.]
MELLKKNIRMTWQKARAATQITLEEDLNVPDSRPDAGSIIQNKGIIRLEETKVSQGQLHMTGFLEVHILYTADDETHSLHRLETRIPFDEMMNLEDAQAGDNIDIKKEMEDLNVHLINSRKLSIQALVSFQASVCDLYDAQAGVELHGAENLSTKTREIRPLSLNVQTRDILRVKEEITLASNKPNIGEILWESVQLRGNDVRVLEGELDVRGELFVFILYAAADEKGTRQWIETSIPFQQNLAVAGSTPSNIPDVEITLSSVNLEVRPDYDGEPRLVALEAVLDLDIRLYQEETVEILEDVYAPDRELIPLRREETYESLVVRNFSKCRTGERLKLEPKKPRMLQICHSEGEVKLDDVQIVPEGLKIEGAVFVTILYVTSDDAMPFALMHGAVPFQHVLEVDGITRNCRYTLRAAAEQLSTTMIDSEEIEVKASVDLNALVVERHREECISGVEEKELDLKKIQEMPSITGYIVQPGDSLWEIAKEWHTTTERIRELNHLESGDIQPGTRILLVKSVVMKA